MAWSIAREVSRSRLPLPTSCRYSLQQSLLKLPLVGTILVRVPCLYLCKCVGHAADRDDNVREASGVREHLGHYATNTGTPSPSRRGEYNMVSVRSPIFGSGNDNINSSCRRVYPTGDYQQ